jgi:uncharacterized iron-regulated membrane protein
MKRLIFKIHRMVGIMAGLLLAIIGLTGSSLVFREEITMFLHPQLQVVVEECDSCAPRVRLLLQQVADLIYPQFPQQRIQFIELPQQPSQPYHLLLKSSTKALTDVYLHPYQGNVLAVLPRDQNVMAVIRQLHVSFLAGEPGKYVVGSCGLLLLALAMTGTLLWSGWRRLKDGFRLRWKTSRLALNYDLHQVGGIISAIFLLIFAATGVLMTFDEPVLALSHGIDSSHSQVPKPPSSTSPANSKQPTLDELLKIANGSLPEGEATFIFPALTEKAAVRVRKRLPQDLHPNGKSYIFLDQNDGHLLRIDRIFDASWVEKLLAWAYPIHIGSYAGWLSRSIYGVMGFILGGLFGTGLLLWWSRTYASRRKQV